LEDLLAKNTLLNDELEEKEEKLQEFRGKF
jgi:hypothetical protein